MLPLPQSLSRAFANGRFAGRELCFASGLLVTLVAGAGAYAQQADSGPGRSPFLPQGWEQQKQTGDAGPAASTEAEKGYVFNGMIQIGSRTLYSVGNAETGHSMLLEAGVGSGDVQINAYNAERKSITLSSGGRTQELTLRKSDGEPLASVAENRGGRSGATAAGGRAQVRQTGGATRSGPPVEWLEARRRRLEQQIERQRAAEAGSGGSSGGAVTVGVGSGTDAQSGTGRNVRQSDANTEGNRTVRARRLRMEMNP